MKMPKEKDTTQYISGAGLKARGWTQAAITKFAGEPHKSAPNPHNRSGPPIRLWKVEEMERIEATPEFVEFKTRNAGRVSGAQRAVETKLERMNAYLQNVRIEVPVLSPENLTRRACRHYNNRQLSRRDFDGALASPQSDAAFLERITVNYLRHELSGYEEELDNVWGKTGKGGAVQEIRAKVSRAIETAYPHLKEECQRQTKKRIAELAEDEQREEAMQRSR